MEKIGFVGLGAMGTPMARNIRNSGYPLCVYNRSIERTEPFRADGIPVSETAKALAGRSDVVVVMVTGPEALASVLEGPEGIVAGLTPGKVVINMSTVSSEATKRAAMIVESKGAHFVDAPVSGSVKPAEDATLVILAGAQSQVLRRVEPLLHTMGKEVIHCGTAGQGTQMKLVLNLVLGNMMHTLAEGLTMTRGFGLEAEALLKALSGGAMNTPLFQAKGKSILDGNYASQFPIHLMLKDLNLVLEAANEQKIPLPQTAATRESFDAAMERGLGHEDMAAVVKVVGSLG